jgi:phosphoribosylformylglycinamidine synthase
MTLAHEVPVLHDISEGGLAVALAEICIASGTGAAVDTPNPFSEDPHRVLVVAEPGTVDMPTDLARKIGEIGGDVISVNGGSVPLSEAADLWAHALDRALAGV